MRTAGRRSIEHTWVLRKSLVKRARAQRTTLLQREFQLDQALLCAKDRCLHSVEARLKLLSEVQLDTQYRAQQERDQERYVKERHELQHSDRGCRQLLGGKRKRV